LEYNCFSNGLTICGDLKVHINRREIKDSGRCKERWGKERKDVWVW
jgi:hypothetical protein